MSMTEVVEESLKADARFRHLTVMPHIYRSKEHEIARKAIESEIVRKAIHGKRERGTLGKFYLEGDI